MLKKCLSAILLSLVVSVAYADAPVMVHVKGNMTNEPFELNSLQWGYQFNNETGKTITFTATVADTAHGWVNMQCWHGVDVENSWVKPGETSKPCVTTDTVRLVTGGEVSLPASGTYNITVGSN